MTHFMQSSGEEEFPHWCASKSEREFSLASTMLPSSPPLSRMVSPEHSHEGGERVQWDAVELNCIPNGICEPSHFEEAMKEIRDGRAKYPVGGLGDDLSKSYQRLRKVAGTADEISKLVSDGCIPEEIESRASEKQGTASLLLAFGLGVIVRFLYLMPTSTFILSFFGFVAILTILPGIYLYAVDGCRPEDYEENATNEKSRASERCDASEFEKSMKEIRGARTKYPIGGLKDEVANSCQLFQKVGISADGDEDCMNAKRGATPLCLLFAFGFGVVIRYLHSVPISTMFFVLMGSVAVLMILPGIYLYAVDGCRPEDYEETNNKVHELFGGHRDDICQTSDFEGAMKEIRGARAAYPTGGLADEVCKSYRRLNTAAGTDKVLEGISNCCGFAGSSKAKHGATPLHLFVAFGLGASVRYLYALSISSVFIVLMGFVAALMVLPGIYLYAVDGCRPEDYDNDVNTEKGGALRVSADEIRKTSHFEESVKAIQSGRVPCPIGGFADEILKSYELLQSFTNTDETSGGLSERYSLEEYEDRASEKQGTTSLCLLLAFGLGFLVRYLYMMSISTAFLALMGAVAVLMTLPGIYLYAVDGCRPEDYEEIGNEQSGTQVFWLTALSLGSIYGMSISGTFRILMGTMAILMLMPGIYLYMVDGCRPEDYEDELDRKTN